MTDIYGLLKTVWYKFCGLIDGIDILRNRYEYLSKYYHPFIPDLRKINPDIILNPFDVINDCISDLLEFLNAFGFDRFKPIPEKEIVNSRTIDLKEWSLFNLKFWEIITLYEIIKSNFYKRTISLEIPQKELGYHRGLERTTGNEGFLLGGDIITEKMLKCINIPFKWDGLFSFSVLFDDIFGAHIRLFRQFNIIHINLSDELKYFGGSYFLIAHELAHCLLYNPVTKIELITTVGAIHSHWYFRLIDELPILTREFQRKRKCDRNNRQNCPISKIYGKTKRQRELFKECLVDYFAVKISGFFYLIAFLDVLPKFGFEAFIRSCFVTNMLSLEDCLTLKESNFYDERIKCFDELFEPNNQSCKKCINDLTMNWGKYVQEYNEDFFKLIIIEYFLDTSEGNLDFFNDFFPTLKSIIKSENGVDRRKFGNIVFNLMNFNITIQPELTITNISKKKFDKLFNFLITEPYKISYDGSEQKNLIKSLKRNEPLDNINPLVLLNLYYDSFQDDKSIDYYTFLFSLFNSKY